MKWIPGLVLMCLVGISVKPGWAGLSEGLQAYKRGNYATALREWQPLAEQGAPVTQLNLGLMYHIGRSVPRDYVEAAQWYRRAAEQGYTLAQFHLAGIYVNGEGVPQDYTQAARWFRKAAEQGDADAQYNLGLMYTNGQGVPQNDAEASPHARADVTPACT